MINKFTLPNDCKIILEYKGNVNSLKILCLILSEAINRDSNNILNLNYSVCRQITSSFKDRGSVYIQNMIKICMENESVKSVIDSCDCYDTYATIHFTDAINTFSGLNCKKFFFAELQDIFYLKSSESIKLYILIKRNTLYNNAFKHDDLLSWLGSKHEKSIFRIINRSVCDMNKFGINIKLHKRKDYWHIEKLQERNINDIGYIDLDDEEELDDI